MYGFCSTHPATKSSLITPPQFLPSSWSTPGRVGKVLLEQETAMSRPPSPQFKEEPTSVDAAMR